MHLPKGRSSQQPRRANIQLEDLDLWAPVDILTNLDWRFGGSLQRGSHPQAKNHKFKGFCSAVTRCPLSLPSEIWPNVGLATRSRRTSSPKQNVSNEIIFFKATLSRLQQWCERLVTPMAKAYVQILFRILPNFKNGVVFVLRAPFLVGFKWNPAIVWAPLKAAPMLFCSHCLGANRRSHGTLPCF